MIKCWAGGRCPPCTPPAGRPLAGREASSASPFGRFHPIIGRGGAAPPHRPPPAGRPSAGGESRALRHFGHLILIINDNKRMMLGGGRLPSWPPPLLTGHSNQNLERFPEIIDNKIKVINY